MNLVAGISAGLIDLLLSQPRSTGRDRNHPSPRGWRPCPVVCPWPHSPWKHRWAARVWEARRKTLTTAARHIRRQETGRPLLGDIRGKIEAAQSAALPSSAPSKACQYALALWKKLTRFLEYPELELSTNLAENSMRPVALGRKNWLHIGSPQAGPKVPALLAVVESCRQLRVPVRDYFSAILPGLADLPIRRSFPDPFSNYHPSNWAIGQGGEEMRRAKSAQRLFFGLRADQEKPSNTLLTGRVAGSRKSLRNHCVSRFPGMYSRVLISGHQVPYGVVDVPAGSKRLMTRL